MAAADWGGRWTQKKLGMLRQYLDKYTTALKRQPFTRLYIDAFAGSGALPTAASGPQTELPLEGFEQLAKGSARLALEVDPPFSKYVFIEKDRIKIQELSNALVRDYPALAARMSFLNEDANNAVVQLCGATNWRNHRAVAFLDPYGMQVDWKTVEAIAATKAIDLWYLFPAGIGVGRMVPRQVDQMPDAWAATIDRCLGTTGWRSVAYSERLVGDLFEPDRLAHDRTFDVGKIEKFVLTRLSEIFAGVGKRGAYLKNSRGNVMYVLFFACGNANGARVALPIANHILEH
jgi:three-Cys-motif partner protein